MANILYDNCFISSHKTIVKEVVEENGLFWHYLEETIFYVESGGMESDEGLIDQHKVIKLKLENGKVWHLLNVKLDGKVDLAIDFHLRLNRSQIHTAQHLISGIVESVYGCKTLSHHIHDKYCDIEFDLKEISERQLIELQVIVNGLIRDDLTVHVLYPTRSELAKYTNKNLSYLDEVRIIKIGEIATEPCACIHVPSLRYIQMVKISTVEKSKKGLKIKFVCGDQLLNNYGKYFGELKKASTLLAQPFEFIEVGILKLMQDNKNLLADTYLLKERYADALVDTINKDEKIYRFFSEMDLKTFAMVCAKHKEKASKLFIFVCHQGTRMQVFVGNNKDSDVIFKQIADQFSLNGSGNATSAQGGGKYNKDVEEVILKIMEEN